MIGLGVFTFAGSVSHSPGSSTCVISMSSSTSLMIRSSSGSCTDLVSDEIDISSDDQSPCDWICINPSLFTAMWSS